MLYKLKRPVQVALFLGVSLVIWNCKKPEETLGLGVQPEDQELNVHYTDTVSLTASTERVDSVKSNNLSRNLIGNYIDPEMGLVRTVFNGQLRLNVVNVEHDDPSALLIDSVFLDLKYTGGYYGSLNEQSFEVLELNEDLYVDSTYYSDKTVLTKAGNLIETGFENITPSPEDTLIVGTDTLGTVMRIKLKNSLGALIMNEAYAGSTVFADNDGFVDFFKGIQIKSNTDDGAVFSFDPSSELNRMTIYYRDPLADDSISTITRHFLLDETSIRYNEFIHDFSGTDLSGIENQNIEGEQTIFIQSAAGTRSLIEFPNLLNVNDSGSVVVNKAELVFSLKTGTSNGFSPVDNIYGIYLDEEKNEFLIPDHFEGDDHVDGVYNEETEQYKLNITRFVQQMLSGEKALQPLYLVSGNSAVSVNRVVLNGTATTPNGIILNLTYSK